MKILSAWIILAIIEVGFTGDKELEKKGENVRKPSGPPFVQLSDLNRTALKAYHETDPYTKGHGKRMAEKLNDVNQKVLRQRVVYLIDNLCSEWYQITGLDGKRTRELLNEIYSSIKTYGPELESRMCSKLLEIRPDLREMDPEIIRSIVHYWHSSIRKEAEIRSREDEADLLFTYHKVRSGKGQIEDRFAEKWKQFHPDLSNCSKRTILNRAKKLLHASPEFSREELKKAKERYESVFGAESRGVIRLEPTRTAISDTMRIQSGKDQADLLHTFHKFEFGKRHVDNRLAERWKQSYPYSSNYTGASSLAYAQNLSHNHPGLSPTEMKAAGVNYGSAKPQKNLEDAERKLRIKWTEKQTIDLLYLTILCKKNELSIEEFKSYWRAMHPELAFAKKKDLENKLNNLRRRKMKEDLTREEEAAAKARLEAALDRIENQQSQELVEQANTEDGKFRSREEEADLLYTYYQVQSGEGYIHDRLAEKWKQFHPRLSNYSKILLLEKARRLSHVHRQFSPMEMKEAEVRYEKVFGTDGLVKRKINWTEVLTADLLHLYNMFKRNEIDSEKFESYWRIMHPELAPVRRRDLIKKISNLRRRKYKRELTPEEEAAADSRFRAALSKYEQHLQNTMSAQGGGSQASRSFQEQEFHQQEPDKMIDTQSPHNNFALTKDDWKWLQILMNDESPNHPPTPHYFPSSDHYGSSSFTTPNQVPFGISHPYFGPSTHDPYNANPYYEHGSSSHSHYDPHTVNPYYEHGSSSHLKDKPNPP